MEIKLCYGESFFGLGLMPWEPFFLNGEDWGVFMNSFQFICFLGAFFLIDFFSVIV
jgi:hypothetical protein